MERKGNSQMPISCKIKKARLCTKKDTLQRLEADLHAKQAHKYTPYFHICSTFPLKILQRTQATGGIVAEINTLKNAKLGTFLDVSSFETPFSYCGRMSRSNVLKLSGFTRPELILELSDISKNAENTQKV